MGAIGPKNRTSRARRNKRRANYKLSTPNLVTCPKCGAQIRPHHVCPKCGTYNKRQVVNVQEA